MSQPTRDSGFTLIELLVVMSLMGAMMAIAVSGWSSWARASEHQGAARELETLLRQTQQQAVTTGISRCVQFDTAADEYVVRAGACDEGPGEIVSGPFHLARGLDLSVATFVTSTGPTPVTGPAVSFMSRGTASPGEVRLSREGSSTQYTLKVEGLSGRVALQE